MIELSGLETLPDFECRYAAKAQQTQAKNKRHARVPCGRYVVLRLTLRGRCVSVEPGKAYVLEKWLARWATVRLYPKCSFEVAAPPPKPYLVCLGVKHVLGTMFSSSSGSSGRYAYACPTCVFQAADSVGRLRSLTLIWLPWQDGVLFFCLSWRETCVGNNVL